MYQIGKMSPSVIEAWVTVKQKWANEISKLEITAVLLVNSQLNMNQLIAFANYYLT